MEVAMGKRYFEPTAGGRWAASRLIDGVWVALIEDTKLFDASDAHTVLVALGITPTVENLDRYFPVRGVRGRCPTLDLMELFAHLPPGTGEAVGV
jgi:hypothetical protein